MVDKYAGWTPYNFAYNDPISINDPMGDQGIQQTNPNSTEEMARMFGYRYTEMTMTPGERMWSSILMSQYQPAELAHMEVMARMDRNEAESNYEKNMQLISALWSSNLRGSISVKSITFEKNGFWFTPREYVGVDGVYDKPRDDLKKWYDFASSGGDEPKVLQADVNGNRGNEVDNNDWSFPTWGTVITTMGLPLIPKKLVPKALLGGMVPKGASKLTSVSSILFRNMVPSSISRVTWLPKAVSFGGQLGRATSAIGVYIFIVEGAIKGYLDMTPEQRIQLGHAGPGATVPFYNQFKGVK